MTKQLYEEALADVKKLKEVAEDNAKKALIEAVAPRIKDLIEAELLREAETSLKNPVDDDLLLDDSDDVSFSKGESEPSIAAAVQTALGGTSPDVTSAISLPDDEGKVTLDLDALSVQPMMQDDTYMLSNESKKFLEPFAKKLNEASMTKFENRLIEVRGQYKKLSVASPRLRTTSAYKKIVAEMKLEVKNLYKYLQESVGNHADKNLYENVLEKFYQNLNQLTEQRMNMKNKLTLNEEDINLKLKLPDGVEFDLNDVEVELEQPDEGEGEEGEEEEEALDLEDEEGEAGEGEEEAPEAEGGEEGGEEDILDLGDEEGKGEKMESRRLSDNTIVEIDEGMLRREISRMKALREAADDVQTWGHGAGDVSDEFEDEDMGDPLELSLTTEGDEMDEDDMNEVEQGYGEADEMSEGDDDNDAEKDDMSEADMDEMYQAMQADAADDEKDDMSEVDMDEMDQAEDVAQMGGKGGRMGQQTQKQSRQPGESVKESLARRIAAERRLQLEAKKKAKTAAQKQKEAKQQAQQKAKQAQMKEQQAKKAAQKKQMKEAQKAKADAQKAQKEAQQKAKQAKQMKEAYDFFATKFNESVQRTTRLQTMLAEVSNDRGNLNGSSRVAGDAGDLRKKLAETNLFNMKLLYTNKLLQNESLTKRQKADVIERLDEAATEREVKLVYESLVKTLSGKSRNLAEGTNRVLGSSSAPTRAASTVLNEGFEADRWAKLAGIK